MLPRVDFETQLQSLRLRVEPLEGVIHALAAGLPQPLRYDSGKIHHGFRYGRPDVSHFCLLKGARAVSTLNAALLLARGGYAQEIGVLVRTIVECTTHIDFVLSSRGEGGALGSDARKYIDDYFADFARNETADFKRAQVRQKAVHESIGANLDGVARKGDRATEFKNVVAATLFSNIYLTFSNYVHAKYPEVMDLYGGTPPHFHLRGMSYTPKDRENVQILDAIITTVSQSLKLLIINLNMRHLIQPDAKLAAWFQSM